MKNKYKYSKVEEGGRGGTRNPIQFHIKEDQIESLETIDTQTLLLTSQFSSFSSFWNFLEISLFSSQSSSQFGTIFSSFINLSNTILGSGMLGLPYAFSCVGWVFGTFLLLLSGFIMSFTLHLLASCALFYSIPTSFSKVGLNIHLFCSLFIDLAVSIKCFGVATSYLIVIGDLMPDVFQDLSSSSSSSSSILEDRRLWMGLMFLIIIPLSFLKNLNSLKFTSTLSIIFVIFLTLLILFYSFHIESSSSSKNIHTATLNSSTLRIFPIFIFSFTCHQVTPFLFFSTSLIISCVRIFLELLMN